MIVFSQTFLRNSSMLELEVPFEFGVYEIYFVYRAETRLWSPQVSEDGKAHPFKINLESEPQV